MMDLNVNKVEKLVQHTLQFLYARTVLEILPKVVTESCYGCDVNHPSQVQHTCLMWSRTEHLDTYFDIAFKRIDEKDIVSKLINQVELMEIPLDYKEDFISTIDDWCIQHKPNTQTVFNMCLRLISLECRFEDAFV